MDRPAGNPRIARQDARPAQRRSGEATGGLDPALPACRIGPPCAYSITYVIIFSIDRLWYQYEGKRTLWIVDDQDQTFQGGRDHRSEVCGGGECGFGEEHLDGGVDEGWLG